MKKTKLPKREIEICNRLREAREWLDLTQEGCAKQIGIERTSLANYELGRSPLRYDIALRFCRQLIISEEWLATGRFDLIRRAAVEHHGQNPNTEWSVLEKKIFIRQCMDFLSEPISRHIPPNTLFSEAYDKHLAKRYGELVSIYYYYPRILFSDEDKPELGVNFLKALNERYLILLSNEALRLHKKPSMTQRMFVRCAYQSTDLIFRKFMGQPVKPEYLKKMDWLRYIASVPEAKIGPLHAEQTDEAPSQKEMVGTE